MATKKAKSTKRLAADARQQKVLTTYKREAHWVTAAAVVILLLVLFLVLSMGYASQWWQNPTRTSQFRLPQS